MFPSSLKNRLKKLLSNKKLLKSKKQFKCQCLRKKLLKDSYTNRLRPWKNLLKNQPESRSKSLLIQLKNQLSNSCKDLKKFTGSLGKRPKLRKSLRHLLKKMKNGLNKNYHKHLKVLSSLRVQGICRRKKVTMATNIERRTTKKPRIIPGQIKPPSTKREKSIDSNLHAKYKISAIQYP